MWPCVSGSLAVSCVQWTGRIRKENVFAGRATPSYLHPRPTPSNADGMRRPRTVSVSRSESPHVTAHLRRSTARALHACTPVPHPPEHTRHAPSLSLRDTLTSLPPTLASHPVPPSPGTPTRPHTETAQEPIPTSQRVQRLQGYGSHTARALSHTHPARTAERPRMHTRGRTGGLCPTAAPCHGPAVTGRPVSHAVEQLVAQLQDVGRGEARVGRARRRGRALWPRALVAAALRRRGAARALLAVVWATLLKSMLRLMPQS